MGGSAPELELVVNGVNGEFLSISVNGIPAGQIFHLRTSADLETLSPLAPAFDFDSNSPQPFQVNTGGASDLFIQVFEGATPAP